MKYTIAIRPCGARKSHENFNGRVSMTAAARVKIAAEAPIIPVSAGKNGMLNRNAVSPPVKKTTM